MRLTYDLVPLLPIAHYDQLLKDITKELETEKKEELEKKALSQLSNFFISKTSLLTNAHLRGALITIEHPIKKRTKKSSVTLIKEISSNNKLTFQDTPLLIIPPDVHSQSGKNPNYICGQWQEKPNDIYIHEEMTLVNCDEEKLKEAKQLEQIDYIKAEELLLPELYFTQEKSLIEDKYKFVYGDKVNTPIIPINSFLLKYF